MLRQFVASVLILIVAHVASGAGILAPADPTLPPLRVTDHLVDVQISDPAGVALTTLTQTFRNDTQQRLEATYVFPLPENADLTDFQMTFNGKMVKGEVLPAEKARQIYESIVRQSRDPGLIEFIGRRLLQMRVFPIEPNSDTTIQVKYQQICRPISGMKGYHYPLRTTKAGAGTGGRAYGEVRFAITLVADAPLKNIWSPTHAVEIVREPGAETKAKIAYEAQGGSLEEDFLLLFDTDRSDLGLSVVAHKPSESDAGHFLLLMTPKQLWPEQERQAQDVVFVVDTSGSMAGEKLEQAKDALKYCVDSLGEQDRFSIVRFSTGFDVLFDEPAAATNDRKAEARRWIDQFTASGGTNIGDTLAHVMTMRPSAEDDEHGRPFVVVFLTDGKGNRKPDETLTMLAQSASKDASLRIFPFGIGHDVNTILLDRLANEYAGRPTYVQPGENLELVMSDFFAVVSQPVLTNLKLDLPGIGVTERFPVTLGDLYKGQQLIVAGRFDRPLTGPVKLTAMRDGKAVEYVWPDVSFAHTAEATYVPALWAGRKISFLIDEIRAHGENEEMIAEVVALSQKYGIQTPYTSWLVNPEQMPITVRRGVDGRAFEPPAPARILRQAERIRAAGGEVSNSAAAVPREELERLGTVSMSIADESGATATEIAQRNAKLKELRNKDEGKLNEALLAARQINGRWYNRVGRYLVDAEVDEATNITVVRFGSEAYFELVRARPELREALAATAFVVVLPAPGQAVMISQTDGVEKFSGPQREQLLLGHG